MSALDVMGVAAGVMFGVGAIAALVRIIRGPTMLDRALAIDVLLAIAMCGLAAGMAVNGHTETLVVLLVLALFAIVGSIAIARFIGKEDRS